MKNATLLELTARWERDARAPAVEDGSPLAQIKNAEYRGERRAKRECADMLRTLVEMFGGGDA